MKSMIHPEEAFSLMCSYPFPQQVERIELHDASGRMLARPMHSERDLPPFHRAMMDGYALRWDDLQRGARTFEVENIQQAGRPPVEGPLATRAVEIMTGAPVPLYADVIVPYEDTKRVNRYVEIMKIPDKAGKHIHRKGTDALIGDTLLQAGRIIGAPEIGIAASNGTLELDVWRLPRMAIISTGDELVAPNAQPLPWQIRQSNATVLQSLFQENQVHSDTFHCMDDPAVLLDTLKSTLLKYEVVIITGGVSKGKWDHVPSVLEQCGIQPVFHRIAQKPGKPMWFGVGNGQWVFALPGNPVSAMVCAVRYVTEWLSASGVLPKRKFEAIAGDDFTALPSLTLFTSVVCDLQGGRLTVCPVKGNGSGDYGHLHFADAFAELPVGTPPVKTGEVLVCYPIRRKSWG